MPWRCPACSNPIRHSELEPAPKPRTRYRCAICRLELMLDEQTKRLEVTASGEFRDDRRKKR